MSNQGHVSVDSRHSYSIFGSFSVFKGIDKYYKERVCRVGVPRFTPTLIRHLYVPNYTKCGCFESRYVSIILCSHSVLPWIGHICLILHAIEYTRAQHKLSEPLVHRASVRSKLSWPREIFTCPMC